MAEPVSPPFDGYFSTYVYNYSNIRSPDEPFVTKKVIGFRAPIHMDTCIDCGGAEFDYIDGPKHENYCDGCKHPICIDCENTGDGDYFCKNCWDKTLFAFFSDSEELVSEEPESEDSPTLNHSPTFATH
jgi:hypothetical protein